MAATGGHVPDDVAEVLLGDEDLERHEGLKEYGRGLLEGIAKRHAGGDAVTEGGDFPALLEGKVDQSNPDYIPLMVTNTLLGGFFSSRITTNIREDKGYTYSPYSSVSTRYRDAYWLQQANVSTEVTAPALKEIFYEIDRLQAEAPSADELAGIKAYMAGVFVLQNSSRNGITNQLAILDLHGLDVDFLSTYVSKIDAVTPEEVRRIATTYLKDDEMTIAIAGDRSQIASTLAPFGTIVD